MLHLPLKLGLAGKGVITAIARRQLTIIASMLRTGECYDVRADGKSSTSNTSTKRSAA